VVITRFDSVWITAMARGNHPVAGTPQMHEFELRRMAEWLKEHAWKLLWRSATACCRFRLPLRSQPLKVDRASAVDHCKPQ